MQDEQLVSNLRKKSRFSRLAALKQLVSTENFETETNKKANFNFNCRTEYSCFDSTPALSAYKLMKNGFPMTAIVDYASLSGAKELMKAEKILGGVYYIGTEVDVTDENGQARKMLSVGIPHKNIKSFNFELFFYRKLQNDFTDELLTKLNSRFKKYDINVAAPARSFFKTTSTEDVFACLAEAVIEKFGSAEAINEFLTDKLGVSLSESDKKRLEDTANTYYAVDLAAALYNNYKLKLPARKCKSAREFINASNSHGAISVLVLSGDVAENLDYALKNGIKGVVFDVDKVSSNFDAEAFYEKCLSAGILPLARMVCDYPKKRLVHEFRDEKIAGLFRETTFAVIGHEITASLNVNDGMFSERSIENTPDLKDRIRLFSRIGLKGSNIDAL